MPRVTVLLAAHNEAGAIGQVVRDVHAALGGMRYNVLVVDDGSTDATAEIAARAGAEVLRLPANQGKGAALRLGYKQATGAWVATLDADGQDDPFDLPRLLLHTGPDVALVIGSRFLGSLHPGAISPLNLAGNLALTATFDLLHGATITDTQAGYRVLRGDVARALVLDAAEYEVETEVLAQVLGRGWGRVVEVPVHRYARAAGTTDFRRVRHGLRILRAIVRARIDGLAARWAMKKVLVASLAVAVPGLAVLGEACENAKPGGATTVSAADTVGAVGETTGDGGVNPDTIGQETVVAADTVGKETAPGAKTCRCSDPGAKLEPDKGCDTWNDKNQCTAWHSVVEQNDKSPDASNKSWPSGQQFCAFGCCIKLLCP